MYTEPFWIPLSLTEPTGARLATMARPRGGDWLEDELLHLRRLGVDLLVSALTGAEQRELDLEAEPQLAPQVGLDFLRLPIVDLGLPSSPAVYDQVTTQMAARLTAGDTVVAHCRQGIGRATLLAVGAMLRLGAVGGASIMGPEQALDRIAEARGRPVPDTEAQQHWCLTQAKKLRALTTK